MIIPLTCLKCKKPIPLSEEAMNEVSYTHYSYCENCLRKGLAAERMLSWLYEWMGEVFDAPCNYSMDGVDYGEYMYEYCNGWCDSCIGKTNEICWERFIEERYNEDQNIK